MLKQENGDTSKNWARICDSCQSAACTVYCRADTAYLCSNCDANIHSATNRVASRHERVWVCEACERAPAAVLCKADSASLCTTCDAEIHSANPLARRHQRVPILPLPGSLYRPSAPTTRELLMAPTRDVGPNNDFEVDDEDEDDETSSWLLLNPVKIGENQANNNGQLLSEVDDYLDLEEYNSCQDHVHFNEDHQHNNQKQHYNVVSDHEHKMYGGDSVVPVQYGSNGGKEEVHQNSFHLGMEYEVSSTAGYGHPMHHSVSLSSMDVGVVPESRMSEDSSSISQQRASKGTIDLFSNDPTALQMPTQLSAIDREARVLRYREKKKMRKFEKTIRYASRKAYAETRPRIKGRFAKRRDNADEMFSTSLMADHGATAGYGIVPSF